MNSEHISEVLAEYLDGRLDSHKNDIVEEHLKTCETCNQEMEELKVLFETFDKESIQVPTERLRANFLRQIEKEEKQLSKLSKTDHGRIYNLIFSETNFLKIAASIALLISAYTLGMYHEKEYSQTQLAILNRENIEVKQTAMLSLIGNKSASKRIQGVNFIDEFVEPDEAIVSALTETMLYDENTNVRRTSVEVLSKFITSEEVKSSFIEALKIETDPGIQIAIINILGDIREKKAAALMQNLLLQENVQPYVKEELESVIPNIL